MDAEQTNTSIAAGIKVGLSVVQHPPEATGFCSLRMFTFDSEGKPTVTVIDLEFHEAERLYDTLGEMLPRMNRT